MTGSLDRRELIKKAAAAGVVVWTAPVIMQSKAAAQGAGTVIIEPGECYKYQYTWWLSSGVPPGNVPDEGTVADTPHNLMRQYDPTQSFPARWHEECQASDDDGVHLAGWAFSDSTAERYKSNGSSVNRQCCPNEPDWWQGDATGAERVPTFPLPECVTITPVCGSAGTGAGLVSPQTIEWFINDDACESCYFVDPFLAYANTAATGANITTSAQGGTQAKKIVIRFGAQPAWPVYLKAWIACETTTCQISDELVFAL